MSKFDPNHPLPYMAAYLDKHGCLTSMFACAWYFYTRDGTYYTDANGDGWSFDKIQKYNLAERKEFIWGNSHEEIKKEIEIREFARKHGAREKESFDFSCPDCGYHFFAREPRDDFENYSERMNCICGAVFSVDVEYEIKTKAKIRK